MARPEVKKTGKRLLWGLSAGLLLVGVLLAALLSLATGEMAIPITRLPEVLRDPASTEYAVLTLIRLPRTVLGLAVGGGLSLAGALLQGIFRNPLVEPYTLGVSGGASLGVTFVIVTGLAGAGLFVLPLAGFLGALATVFLVYALSLRRGLLSTGRMLLIGVMVSFVSSSLIMLLMSLSRAEDLPGIIFWSMGSLAEPEGGPVWGLAVLSPLALLTSLFFTPQLNALRLGETKARHLGVRTAAATRILFVIASLLTGACISVSGVIGFVGLVIPHVVRLVWGGDYRFLLVASFLLGGVFLTLCDLLARTIIAPIELPIGVITGLIGGIAFIAILSGSKKRSAFFR